MRLRFIFLSIIYIAGILSSHGQDGYFTQFFQAPLYLNPSSTGRIQSKARININYRNGWFGFQNGDQNYHASIDFRSANIGIGFNFYQEQTGMANLKTNQGAISLALHKLLSQNGNELSAGFQFGVIRQFFEPEKFTFDSQYTPGLGFDPIKASGEVFESTDLLLPNFNAGVTWTFPLSSLDRISSDLGLAFSHINQPNGSFQYQNNRFPLKTSIHGKLTIALTDQFQLSPKVLVQKQGPAKQTLLFGTFTYEAPAQKKITLGIGGRIKTSFIGYLGLAINNYQIGFSFDHSISKLPAPVPRDRSFELSLTIDLGKSELIPEMTGSNDKDGDGIIDSEDKCPEIAGSIQWEGCQKASISSQDDFDKDGILDVNDLCPFQFGFLNQQGCSDRDNDQVWDHVDACPSIPGNPSNFGCPTDAVQLDSDNDGVIDQEDHCVYIKGDKNLNGCPDTDLDGISDLEDHCPYLAGKPESGGCPELGRNGASSVDPIATVEFDSDKFQIKNEYLPILDQLAQQLISDSGIQLVIEGHTDNEGDPIYNFYLSYRRASAVQNYLLSIGVSAGQLDIHAFGESKPRYEGNGEQAKSRNRRTEIYFLN